MPLPRTSPGVPRTPPPPRRGRAGRVLLGVAAAGAAGVIGPNTAAHAHADEVAYLVNVTVRPGYDFPSADAALSYGKALCAKVGSGSPYASIMSDVKRDFGVTDEYQASYLITQAANELCPGAIWQLRNSAAGYRPGSE